MHLIGNDTDVNAGQRERKRESLLHQQKVDSILYAKATNLHHPANYQFLCMRQNLHSFVYKKNTHRSS